MEKKTSEQKVQVRFPLDVWQEVKRLAKQNGRSFNGEVVWALKRYIAQPKGEKEQ